MSVIGIMAKVHDPRCQVVARDLVEWLLGRGHTPLLEKHLASQVGSGEGVIFAESGCHVDLMVVLGGDGTLISAVRATDKHDIPVLGVNLGSLGFLTEITLDELYPALEQWENGDCRVTERMMLDVSLVRGDQLIESYHVLNDVVINKGVLARIIDLETSVDDLHLTTYKSDGLIIATPTGSTGYSLSAGGPIMHPSINSIVITPICPHTLTNRPIVVNRNSTVGVRLSSISNDEVFLTLDGQVGVRVKENDTIKVCCSTKRAKLIASSTRDYFEVLRTKLKWGER